MILHTRSPASNQRLRRMQIALAFLALAAVMTGGVVGLVLIEGMSVLHAAHLTVMIMTTIGLAALPEINQLSPEGLAFVTGLAMVGLSVFTYAGAFLVREIVAGEMNSILGRRIMERQLNALKEHYILCGYGRLGQIIAAELQSNKVPFAIIEPSDEHYASILNDGYIGLQGNALDDETLKHAGIERAQALISTIDSDADNVFVILSARQLNPRIRLVVRAESESAISKLKHVGADVVVSPITLGGETIAQSAMRPNVVDFINITTRARHQRYQIEEIQIGGHSLMAGQSLRELAITAAHGVMIIGVTRANADDSIFNPSADTVLHVGDILIVLGESLKVDKFKTAMAKK